MRSRELLAAPPLTLGTNPPRSARTREVASIFGLEPPEDSVCPGTTRRATITLPQCSIPLPSSSGSGSRGGRLSGGGVVFITGPSGGGKSLLLARLRHALREQHDRPVIDAASAPLDRDRAIVDLIPGSLQHALGAFSRAGLAEAAAFLQTPAQLSEGQRHRFTLAWALAAAQLLASAGGCFIFADEFLSPLDRTTACNIALTIRRWLRSTAITLIAATAHDDLLEPLSPDVLVHIPLTGRPEVIAR